MKKKRDLIVFVIIVFLGLYLSTNLVSPASSQEGNLSVGVEGGPSLGVINSSIFVCETEYLAYAFEATSLEGGLITFDISPMDPFFLDLYLFSGTGSIINYILSGELSKAEAGGVNIGFKSYIENISVTDGVTTDSAITNITVLEINEIPIIEPVGVQTIWINGVNSTFYHNLSVVDKEYDEGYGSLTYNISIINASGSKVSLFNISSEGIMNYTAIEGSEGIYNITVCVWDTGITNSHVNISAVCGQDGSSQYNCTKFSLTSTHENRAPTITSYYPQNTSFSVSGTQTLYFNVSEYDPDGTIPDATWYVDGVFVDYDSGSLNDELYHTFGCGVSGIHRVTVNVTDGELSTSLEWTVSVDYVECTPSVAPGGGDGGGSQPQIVNNFILDKDLIKVLVKQGETKRETLEITNVGDTYLRMVLKMDSAILEKFMILSDESFFLMPGASKVINVDFFTRETDIPEAYTGRILVEGGGIERQVNVILEVKEKKPLFDLFIDVVTDELLAGEDVKAEIKMKNMGDLRNIDILVYYAIKDFEGNILSFREESIAMEKELDITRKLKVPSGAGAGAYVYYVKVSYNDIMATGTDVFTVVEKRSGGIYFLIAIILLILLAILIAYELGRKSPE